MEMIEKRITLLIVLLCAFGLLLPAMAAAERLRFTPSVAARAGYDDNILFNFNETISDSYFSIKPGIRGDYGTRRLQLGMDAYTDIIRYSQEQELDVENYWLEFNGRYKATERLAVTGEVSYRKDTTLDSELEETGRVGRRDNRDRYRGIVGFSYELNEISGVEAEYEYAQTLYEQPTVDVIDPRLDREVHGVIVPFYWWLNSRLDRVSFGPGYSRAGLEDNTTIDYYNLNMGWTHIFDETLRFRGRVGYGYTQTNPESGEERLNRAGTADLSLTKFGAAYSYRVGYRSQIRLSSAGELIEIDRLYISLKKNVTERFRFLFTGNLYGSRPVEAFDQVDRVYFDLKPEFRYYITENLSSSLAYRYSKEYNRELPDNPERDRNIVEFRLNYQIDYEK